jgi:hypothetical protein
MYQKSREAATDVEQLVSDLAHGAFQNALSVAVSRTASRVHDDGALTLLPPSVDITGQMRVDGS